MTGHNNWTTDVDMVLTLLALPASTLDRVSQPAVRDAVQYFTSAIITIPGVRTPTADATARDAAPDVPVLHPQLGRGGTCVHHYRYSPDTGVHEAPDAAPPPETIDILAVQNGDILPRLQTQLSSGERQTGSEAATFIFVPQLTVEWDTTTLSTTLPHAEQLAAITAMLPEPVTVLAGGQPAEYYHEWELPHNHSTVRVPMSGLGASAVSRRSPRPQGARASDSASEA